MNSVERENFFDYLSAMYAERAYCDSCVLKEECQAEGDIRKCYERVLSELTKVTEPYPSAEKWVEEMNELQSKDNVQWTHFRIHDEKHTFVTTFVFDMKNALKRAYTTCRGEEFDPNIGKAIAYARLRGLPIHEDFATKHDEVL